MTSDVNRERLDRLRGELADLRARASALGVPAVDPEPRAAPRPAEDTVELPVVLPEEVQDGDVAPVEQPPAPTPAEPPDPEPEPEPVAAPAPDPEPEPEPVAAPEPEPEPTPGAEPTPEPEPEATPAPSAVVAEEPATPIVVVHTEEDPGPTWSTTADAPPRRRFRGRQRRPRPPRRNPLRRRAHRPPQRLAVPTPIPVRRRPDWVAAPRWPKVTFVGGLVMVLVLVPVCGQLALRLWTAMNETSFLLGADPTRADWLRTAAGVAGGGITTALATFALGLVRGRPGYLAGGLAVLLLFVAFPYVAHTANAGLVSAPLPSLGQMVTPTGWEHPGFLQATFVLAAGSLVAAVADLAWRSVVALRDGLVRPRLTDRG